MANTNAGSVSLGIKFDGSTIQKGINDSLKKSQQVANEQGQKIASNLDKATSGIGKNLSKNTKKAVDDSIKELSKLDQEVNKILNNGKSKNSKAMSIASLYQKEGGMNQGDAQRKAWDIVGRKAKEAGDAVSKSTDKAQKKTNKFFNLFSKRAKTAKKEASSVGTNLSSGVGGALKKLALLGGSAFAVTKLVDWGKQAISLSSDLQEVENVVSTSFGNMQYKIEDFTKTSIEKFGISELSAKKMAGTFMAMGKGMGQGLDQGSDMAVELTGRLADIMSFWNKSAEEVETIGRAIYSGESEPLKAIGVIANESSLANYALSKSYGKLYKDMTDAEKLLVRQEYFLEKTNLAAGDFAKTLDSSWSNQVKVLSENIKNFASSVGTILINILLPVVKFANVVIKKVGEVTSALADMSGKIFGKAQVTTSKATAEMTTGLEGIADSAGVSADAIDGIAEATKKASRQAAGFDQLTTLQAPEEASSSGSSGGEIASSLESSSEEMKKIEEEATPVEKAIDRIITRAKELANIFNKGFKLGLDSTGFDGAIANIKSSIESIKNNFLGIFADGQVLSSFNSLADNIALTLGSIVGNVVGVGASIGNAIFGGIASYFEENKGFLKEKLLVAIETLNELTTSFRTIFDGLSQIVADTFNSSEFQRLVGECIEVVVNPFIELRLFFLEIYNDLFKMAAEFVDRYKVTFTNGFIALSGLLADILDGITQIIMDVINSFKEAYDMYVKPYLDKLMGQINDLMDDYLIPLGKTFVDCCKKIWENVMILWNTYLKPFVDFLVKNFVEGFMQTIDVIVSIFLVFVSRIAQFVDGMIQIFSGLIDFLTGLFTGDWDRCFRGVKDIAEGLWKQIKSIIGGAIELIYTTITGFTKNVEMTWKEKWNSIKTTTYEFFTNLPYKLGEMIGQVMAKIVSFFINLPKKIQEYREEQKKKREETWNNIKEWFQNLIEWIPKKIEEIVNFFRNINLKDIGRNMIDGLKSGFDEKLNSFKDSLSNFTSGIKDGFMSALDIHSPSRWMRDVIAGNMIKGLEIGLETNTDGVLSTLDNLRNDMSNVMNIPLNAPQLAFVGGDAYDEKELNANVITKEDKIEALLTEQNSKIDTLTNIINLILQKDTTLMIDDQVLGKTVETWSNRESRRRG